MFTDREHALIHLGNDDNVQDMRLSDARVLAKASQQGIERKRVTSNVFTSLSGRSQPRQGFLSPDIMRACYLRSELIRACVDTLIKLVCTAPWGIRPIDEDRTRWLRKRKPEEYLDQQKRIRWLSQFFKEPAYRKNLSQFHDELLRDLLIYDAASYEIVTTDYGDGDRLPVELGIMAGDTVELETDDAGEITRYWQSRNVIQTTSFEVEEMAYLKLYSCSWQPYGISPIETAWISITSDLSASKYNSDYFSKNAIPPALLAVLGVSDREFRSITSQLRQTSNDNPHNLHTVRAQRNPDGSAQKIFELVPLSQVSNKDMQFAELLQMCVNRITMLYGVTPSQIGFTDQTTGGIGSGVAETQENLGQNKGIAPLLSKLEDTHTTCVIREVCGWDDLEFAFVLSNTPQEQAEYQRSVQEVSIGIKTINEFRQQWGGRRPLDWGDAPVSALPGYQPKQSPGDLQQQAGQMGGAPPGQPPQPAPPPQMAKPPEVPGADMQKSAKRIVINF